MDPCDSSVFICAYEEFGCLVSLFDSDQLKNILAF